MELYENWGSGGYVYVDGIRIGWFLPRQSSRITTVRLTPYRTSWTCRLEPLQPISPSSLADITWSSEVFIDNLKIYGACLNLSVSDVALAEGNWGNTQAVFVVSLSTPSDQPVGFTFATADGSARAGTDYLATNGTVTLSPGQTNVAIPVTVIGNPLYELNKIFYLSISSASNAYIVKDTAVATILNDDVSPDLQVVNVQAPSNAVAGTAHRGPLDIDEFVHGNRDRTMD